MDVVKQRMQLYGSQKLYGVGVWSCARAVAREGGFRAFYVSYPTTVAMNIPVFFLLRRDLVDFMSPTPRRWR